MHFTMKVKGETGHQPVKTPMAAAIRAYMISNF